MIEINELMELTNKKYAEKKRIKFPFTAPELLPQEVISDQIKALAEAICEILNKR